MYMLGSFRILYAEWRIHGSICEIEQASGEINWYRSLFGDENVVGFIKKVLEARTKFDKKWDKDKDAIKDVIVGQIKMYDEEITCNYKKIMSKRNEDVRKRYTAVIDPVLEIVYPQFLQDLHKNNKI
jgi:RNAse (barnase) inhibitor barstar